MSGNALDLSWAKGVVIADENEAWVIARESQVLGSLFLRPECYSEVNHLDPRDFCVAQFRAAWGALSGFARAGDLHKITPLAVAQAANIPTSLMLRCAAAATSVVSLADFGREMQSARALREALTEARRSVRETDPVRMMQALQRAARTVGEVRDSQAYRVGALTQRFLDRYSAISTGAVAPAPSTGMPVLDEVLGGLEPESLIVVAGRPGMGKTVATVSIARQAALNGTRIGYFSLEIGERQFTPRLLADATYTVPGSGIWFNRLMRGQVIPADYPKMEAAIEQVQNLPIWTDFSAGMTMADIDARVARWSDEAGAPLDAVFIDYSAFVRDSGQYRNQVAKQVGEVFLDAKMMARRRRCAVVFVHQLNRGVESRDDKRPNMADLRDSGEVEQHADAIALLYRHEYYLRRLDSSKMSEEQRVKHEIELADATNRVEVIVDKNRAGAPGSVFLECDVKCSAIRNMAQPTPGGS